METIAAGHEARISRDEPSSGSTEAPNLEELVGAVRRAATPDEAFRLARRAIPHPLPLPDALRRALFEMSADDLVIKKVLFCAARRDEDVVQDTLAWWWERGIQDYQPGRASVRTLLFLVAQRRLTDGRRTALRRGALLERDGGVLVAEQVDRVLHVVDPEARAQLAEALHAVRDDAATAWLLRTIPGCTNAEIARAKRSAEGAVSREVAAVQAILERRLARHNPAIVALLGESVFARFGLFDRLAARIADGRRALGATMRATLSHAVVAGLAAVVTARAVPPRVVRVPVPTPVPSAVPSPPRGIEVPPPVAPARVEPAAPARVEPAAPARVEPAAPALAVRPAAPRAARVANQDANDAQRLLDEALQNLADRPGTSLARVRELRGLPPRSALALTRDAIEAEALDRLGQPERALPIAARVFARDPGGPEAARLRARGLEGAAP